jgi:hypothetical protein
MTHVQARLLQILVARLWLTVVQQEFTAEAPQDDCTRRSASKDALDSTPPAAVDFPLIQSLATRLPCSKRRAVNLLACGHAAAVNRSNGQPLCCLAPALSTRPP